MRVAIFATCLVDTLVPQVARATAVRLERLGHEVVVPPGQSRCGQMHVNTGYRREAVPIIANHVRAFAGRRRSSRRPGRAWPRSTTMVLRDLPLSEVAGMVARGEAVDATVDVPLHDADDAAAPTAAGVPGTTAGG